MHNIILNIHVIYLRHFGLVDFNIHRNSKSPFEYLLNLIKNERDHLTTG